MILQKVNSVEADRFPCPRLWRRQAGWRPVAAVCGADAHRRKLPRVITELLSERLTDGLEAQIAKSRVSPFLKTQTRIAIIEEVMNSPTRG